MTVLQIYALFVLPAALMLAALGYIGWGVKQLVARKKNSDADKAASQTRLMQSLGEKAAHLSVVVNN